MSNRSCSICNGRLYEKFPDIYSKVWLISYAFYWFCNTCKSGINFKYGLFWNENNGIGAGHKRYKLIGPILNDMKDMDSFKKKILQSVKLEKSEKEQREKDRKASDIYIIKKRDALKKSIIKLLKEKAVKMPASDIDAFLKYQNVDEIKELCDEMYHNGKISRTANYRYFILSEEKKEPKKASVSKSEEVDVEKELEKLKGLLDKGLITQEQYDAKSNKLIGL